MGAAGGLGFDVVLNFLLWGAIALVFAALTFHYGFRRGKDRSVAEEYESLEEDARYHQGLKGHWVNGRWVEDESGSKDDSEFDQKAV